MADDPTAPLGIRAPAGVEPVAAGLLARPGTTHDGGGAVAGWAVRRPVAVEEVR
jgi:hypothetical protein